MAHVTSAAEMRGVTATEIRIGQTMPYSGPVSAFGALGKGEVGYFKMINERGGINGRKVNLISLDDGYAPPKTVEQTRRLKAGLPKSLNESSRPPSRDPYSVPVRLEYDVEASVRGDRPVAMGPGSEVGTTG